MALLYGGAKGGGKSMLFCIWVDEWCLHLMKLFGLKPMKNPIPVGFIGRKQGSDFRTTTLETFRKVVPQDHYEIKEHKQEIIFFKCLKVYYGGLDDKKRINKFNSAELAFLAIDQAEETERTDVDVLQGALRLKVNGITPPYKEFYSANPAECWLKEDFIDEPQPNHYFVPALYTDNPHLPENYEQTLIKSFRYNAALLAAYKDGDWYALQATNSLLSAKQLADLKKVKHYPKVRKGIVSCDPSLGGDACVIKVIENYKTIYTKEMYVRKPMLIAGEMMVCGQRHGIPNFCADTTGGLGEAILDRIGEVKPNTNRISLSYSETDTKKNRRFKNGKNLRSEMAWHYMMKVIDREIPYPEDETTRKQILAYRFKVVDSQGRILLEPKAETKKRLGQSPDHADTEIQGMWALDETEPIVKSDAWDDQPGAQDVSSGVESAMTA